MKNVVMISIDDLFNVVRFKDAYGVDIQTPNIDRLLDMGVYFDNAHALKPACNPSRASAMTSLSLYKNGVIENSDTFYTLLNAEDTLPYAFKQAGYTTVGMGKLFHGELPAGETSGAKVNWLTTAFTEYMNNIGDMTGAGNTATVGNNFPGDMPEEDHADPNTAAFGAAFITEHQDADDPYFLALGLHKPHLLWNVPQKYYDLYDPSQIVIPDTPTDDYDDVPFFFQHTIASLMDLHVKVTTADEWVAAIHSYMAAISFADAQLGLILDAMDATGSWDDTTLVLWSDHGYHLGNKETWGKFTHWEQSTNAPLIFVDPDIGNGGTQVDTPVSLLDIMPTLLDLTGVSAPGPERDGSSLVPILEDPTADHQGLAASVFGGSISLRDNTYRYIISITGEEQLYHIANDPNQFDNLAVSQSDEPVIQALLTEFRQLAGSEATRLGMVTNFFDTSVAGTDSDEWLMVSNNVETISGGLGDDTYDIYQIEDLAKLVEFNGGGFDHIRYLSTRTGWTEVTLPENVEGFFVHGGGVRLNVSGNDASNMIEGTGLGDAIYLLGGDDTAKGGGGYDTIEGAIGHDYLDGGNGDDRIHGGAGNDTVLGGTGTDMLEGANGDDRLHGDTEDDTLRGGRGDDALNGDEGADRINAGAGDDTALGGAGNDTINGKGGDDLVNGEDGDDFLRGGQGSDSLLGGTGDDVLYGDAGNDTLSGGAGVNTLWGGKGADRFVLIDETETDVIGDFTQGVDVIDLSAFGLSGLSDLVLTSTATGTQVQATGLSFTLVLEGVDAAALVSDDVWF